MNVARDLCVHDSVWVDCSGSQLDTYLGTVGAVAIVLGTLGTGLIHQCALD